MKRKFEIHYHTDAFASLGGGTALPVEFECDMVLYPHQCGGVYTFNDKRPGVDSDSYIGPAYDAKLVLDGGIVAMVRDITPVNEAPTREDIIEALTGTAQPSPEMPPHTKRPQLWDTEGENCAVPGDAHQVTFMFKDGNLIGSTIDEDIRAAWFKNKNIGGAYEGCTLKTVYISF